MQPHLCHAFSPAAALNWLQDAPVLDVPPKLLVYGAAALSCGSCVWVCRKSAEKRAVARHRNQFHRRRVAVYLKEFDEEVEAARGARRHLVEELSLRVNASIVDASAVSPVDLSSPQVWPPLLEAGEPGSALLRRPSGSFRMAPSKLIHVVNLASPHHQKRLRVHADLDEDKILRRAQQAVRIPPDEPVSVVCLSGGMRRVPRMHFDEVVDGAVYVLRVESSLGKRRHSLVERALNAEGELRYSKGVDFTTVLELLKRSVMWGDGGCEDRGIITKLHQMLALNLLERMEAFWKNPDDAVYAVTDLDKIDRDLNSLLASRCSTSSAVGSVAAVFGCGRRVAAYRRRNILDVGGESGRGFTDAKRRELLEFLDSRIRKRATQTPLQLLRQLRPYVTAGNTLRVTCVAASTLFASLLRPCAAVLEARFAREVMDASSAGHIRRVGLTAAWVVGVQVCESVCVHVRKHVTERAVSELFAVRRVCLERLAAADQSFIDALTKDDEEDRSSFEARADTLESDVYEVCSYLRQIGDWWSAVTELASTLCFLGATGRGDLGRAALAGAVAGTAFDRALRAAAGAFARWVAGDTVGTLEGAKVVYAPCKPDAGCGVEPGEVGEVVDILDQRKPLKCAFSRGRVVFLSDVDVDTVGSAVQLLPAGGPDGITGRKVFKDSKMFAVFRAWGMEVSQLRHGLDREHLIKKRAATCPSLVPTVVAAAAGCGSKAASAVTTVVAAWVALRLGGRWTRTAATNALGCCAQMESVLDIVCDLPTEVHSNTCETLRGASRIAAVVDYRPTIDTGSGSAPAVLSGDIVLEDVHLRYGTNRSTLQGMCLRIGAGEVVALVGKNGCGKTSLFKVLARLYDTTPEPLRDGEVPDVGKEYLVYRAVDREWSRVTVVRDVGGGAFVVSSDDAGGEWPDPVHVSALGRVGTGGRITIGGHDVRSMQPRHLRGAVVATMLQEVTLFDGTIGFNIKYGRPRATAEQVAEVCDAAMVTDFLGRYKERLLTRVGTGGVELSGGEARRVGLARAMLACVCTRSCPTQGRASVLLLDEPSVGLDPPVAASIRDNLHRFAEKHRVTVVINSHLFPLIRRCRLLLFGDQDDDSQRGRIVAEGSYQELYQKHRLFKEVADTANAAPVDRRGEEAEEAVGGAEQPLIRLF